MTNSRVLRSRHGRPISGCSIRRSTAARIRWATMAAFWSESLAMCLRIATKWRMASKPLSSRCFSFARLTPCSKPFGYLFMRDRLVGVQLGNTFGYLTELPFFGFDVVCNGFGGKERFGAVTLWESASRRLLVPASILIESRSVIVCVRL